IRAGMHVADDALACGNAVARRKAVLDRVARHIARDGRIVGEAQTAVAVDRVRAGVHPRAVVPVDHMTGGAAAGAIVARVVIGAQEIEGRVEEAGLLEADQAGVSAVLGPQAAVAEAGEDGPTVLVGPVGDADLRSEPAAALENAKDIARLADLE